MATHDSPPPCAPLGLLLLLIGVISSHLPAVQTEPTDFWCNDRARKNMGRDTEGLEGNWTDCVGSSMLPSPVQLPCVAVHVEEWENKTLSQKLAEVVGALETFKNGMLGVKNQTALQCQTPLLTTLLHNIENYLVIISAQQCVVGNPSHPDVQMCSSQTSMRMVLKQYRKLLMGKVERLAADLQDSRCAAEPTTAKTK